MSGLLEDLLKQYETNLNELVKLKKELRESRDFFMAAQTKKMLKKEADLAAKATAANKRLGQLL